mgnify:CR=1 FL=1
MKTEYVCQNCKKRFNYPQNKDGMFVCPNCESPDFETINHEWISKIYIDNLSIWGGNLWERK